MNPIRSTVRSLCVLVLLLAVSSVGTAAAQGPPDIAWVGKGGFASSLAMSPDGQSFVVANLLEHRLKMWRTDGTYVRTFGDDGSTPHWSMAYSPDGQFIVAGRESAVGSGQPTALLYRASDGTLVRALNPGPEHDFGFVHKVDYSPVGNLVAVAYNEYVSGIELYNPLTGALVRSLPEGGYDAKFSRDGLTIAGTRQGGARLWRVSDGAVLHTFPVNGGLYSFSRDGQVLAIGQNPYDPSVRLFRTSDGELLRTIVPATVQTVESIEFSPAQDLLVIAGYRDGGRPEPPLSDNAIDAYHLDGSLAWSYFHLYGLAFQVGFTPNGQTLMVAGAWVTPPIYVEGGTDTILRLDPATGAELAHFAPNRGASNRVAFSPDGRLFASAGANVMQVWNALEGTVAHTFDHGAGSVQFSRDGTRMVANVGNIGVWSVPGYALLHVLAGHNNGTTDAIFNADGTLVVSGGFDNLVKVRRFDGSLVWSQPVNSPPLTLAASPDGQVIAAGTRGSTVYLWRASDGMLLRRLVGVNVVQTIAFSPDSSMLAAAENNYFENLKLYRISDGALLRSFTDPTYGFQKNSVAFTPDGAMLVFTSGGQYIELWRIADGALLRLYDEETGTGPYARLPVAVSPNGRFFGYGREDSMLVMARNPFAPACDSTDFDCDGDRGTDADIEAFFACAAGACPSPPCPNTADFDHDGDPATDADIEAFFRVLAGLGC